MRMRTAASAAAAAAVAVAALLGSAGTAAAKDRDDENLNMLINRATMAPLLVGSTGSNGDWNSGPMMNPMLMG